MPLTERFSKIFCSKAMREVFKLRFLHNSIFRASPQLAWFMVYTSLCVLGFVLTFSLMFGAHSYNYSSLKPSMYSCYLLLLGVFDWADFIRTDPVGPIMFMVFCIVMTMVLINIFMTILMEVYAEVRIYQG